MNPAALDALDVARAYMRAWNRRDVQALIAAYHDDARVQLFAPVAVDGAAWEGREAIARGLEAFFAAFEGALASGQFFDVRTIARIETGWTHVEWVAAFAARAPMPPPAVAPEVPSPAMAERVSTAASVAAGTRAAFTGYFHFRIRDGRIAEQRAVAHEAPLAALDASDAAGVPGAPDAATGSSVGQANGANAANAASTGEGAPTRSPRTYPSRPIVGVGAVIILDGRIVLIKRKYEPLAGQWSLPGGSLEVGETLEAGVAREMLEETGLHVEVGPVIDVFDRILLDADRRVRYHFVLIDYLCVPRGGALKADSDVADARLVDIGDLAEYRLTPKAEEVIRKGYDLYLRRQAK